MSAQQASMSKVFITDSLKTTTYHPPAPTPEQMSRKKDKNLFFCLNGPATRYAILSTESVIRSFRCLKIMTKRRKQERVDIQPA